MAEFQKGNKASPGRPAGSKNVKSQFSASMTKKALKQLEIALDNGEQFAIDIVLKRTHPPLKPITPESSIDGEFLKLKMKEISEFEERLNALEQRHETN